MTNNPVHVPVTEADLKTHAATTGGRRVTRDDVDKAIVAKHFFTGSDGVFGANVINGNGGAVGSASGPLSVMTFCVLVLKNGFTVTGQSACADPAMFNEEIGRNIAFNDAVSKIWPLLGYALRDEMDRETKLLIGRAFYEKDGFEVYIGTKVIHATPMSRAIYNDFRGWTMPENEEDDDGYLVEYTDGGQRNSEGFEGYVSWSPKEVFERSYRAVGQDASASEPAPGQAGTGACDLKKEEKKEESWIDRLFQERRELSERCAKLGTYLNSKSAELINWQERHNLIEQLRYMRGYLMVLDYRIAALPEVPAT